MNEYQRKRQTQPKSSGAVRRKLARERQRVIVLPCDTFPKSGTEKLAGKLRRANIFQLAAWAKRARARGNILLDAADELSDSREDTLAKQIILHRVNQLNTFGAAVMTEANSRIHPK